MKIDSSVQTRLQQSFKKLSKTKAASFPAPRALSDKFEAICKRGSTSVAIGIEETTLFATGAVEMWHRAIHSFLVSSSLTVVSPIWGSVSGYYSSHYTMRALAHALGYFHMFRCKKIIRCNIDISGKFFCDIDKKSASDREHKSYWKIVKNDAHFNSDPLFRFNNDEDDVSDVSHRNHANYADHLSQFPIFKPLDLNQTKERITRLSKIQIYDPPIPDRTKFPDMDNVQLVAYHRLIRFRRFIDEAVGSSDRFWNLHREPSWAREFLDYQAVDPTYLGVYRS